MFYSLMSSLHPQFGEDELVSFQNPHTHESHSSRYGCAMLSCSIHQVTGGKITLKLF